MGTTSRLACVLGRVCSISIDRFLSEGAKGDEEGKLLNRALHKENSSMIPTWYNTSFTRSSTSFHARSNLLHAACKYDFPRYFRVHSSRVFLTCTKKRDRPSRAASSHSNVVNSSICTSSSILGAFFVSCAMGGKAPCFPSRALIFYGVSNLTILGLQHVFVAID